VLPAPALQEDVMKLRMVLLLSLVGLLTGGVLLAQSGIGPAQEKEADIRRLIEMTGSSDLGAQLGKNVLDQILPTLENMFPPGPKREEIVGAFRTKLKTRFNPQELTELMIPVYDKHMTREEIQELIEFYQTPLGQRVLKIMPAVMQESQAIGSQWGEKIFQDVIREMEEEFPELRQPPR
jgi:hypothetical protein